MTPTFRENLDKLAIFLSGVCILHCLLAPILLTLMPILSINAFVEDIIFHQMILWVIIPSSLFALTIGCKNHKQLNILISGVIGILALIFIASFGHDFLGENLERWATSIAGIILAYSHYANYRACQQISCNDTNCAQDHHH